MQNMKKLVAGLTVVTLLTLGAVAFAHGPGWFAGDSMGYGYGPQMMGPAQGGHMMGWSGAYDKKFLEETADVRKEFHNKQFEYFEAVRNPKTKPETITKLEKEIRKLQEKLYAQAHRTGYRGYGYGHCWE